MFFLRTRFGNNLVKVWNLDTVEAVFILRLLFAFQTIVITILNIELTELLAPIEMKILFSRRQAASKKGLEWKAGLVLKIVNGVDASDRDCFVVVSPSRNDIIQKIPNL